MDLRAPKMETSTFNLPNDFTEDEQQATLKQITTVFESVQSKDEEEADADEVVQGQEDRRHAADSQRRTESLGVGLRNVT